MRAALLCLVCLIQSLLIPVSAEELVLRAGVIETNIPPFVIRDANRHTVGGIDIELPRLVAQTMGKSADIIFLSRKRLQLALLDGSIDLVCGMDRRWLTEAGELIWSGPLYQSRDIVLSRNDQATLNSINDLRGSSIGTLTGYIYPNLQDEFLSGRLRREDSNSAPSLVNKLIAGRIHHIITTDIYLFYLLRQSTTPTQFNPQVLTIDSNKLECAAKPGQRLGAQEFHNAIDKLQQTKAIEKLLENYR